MSEDSIAIMNTRIVIPNKVITTAEAVKIALPFIQKLVIEGMTLKNIQDQVAKWKTK